MLGGGGDEGTGDGVATGTRRVSICENASLIHQSRGGEGRGRDIRKSAVARVRRMSFAR
jgi:hypothetical protein